MEAPATLRPAAPPAPFFAARSREATRCRVRNGARNTRGGALHEATSARTSPARSPAAVRYDTIQEEELGREGETFHTQGRGEKEGREGRLSPATRSTRAPTLIPLEARTVEAPPQGEGEDP